MSQDKFLSNKRALLASPGTMYNDLYYSVINASTSLVETTYMNSKNYQSLPSVQFNSSSSINLQNENFIDRVYLHLVLPAVVANQTLCRGWGYHCIREISWLMGSSSSVFTLEGESILNLLLNEADDQDSKNELLRLGGEEHLTTTSGTIEATVMIPLPFSSLCMERLGFPTDLLSSNVQVTIKFKDASSIYGGIGARPTAFNQAILSYREGVLTDKAMSLRYEMMANPQLLYSYPFIFSRQLSKRFTGSTTTDVQIQLDGFLNSDLLGIIFYCVKESDISPQSSLHPNPLNTDDIRDVSLLYNGNFLYRSFGSSWKLQNMLQLPGYVQNSINTSPNNTGPFTSEPKNSYICNIDFTRLKAVCQPKHMFNTFRVANQVLNLRFKTTTTDTYTIYATYLYNGIIQVQAGVSEVYFD